MLIFCQCITAVVPNFGTHRFHCGTFKAIKVFPMINDVSDCFFFGYQRYDGLTRTLFELGLPSLATFLFNSKQGFETCCNMRNNAVAAAVTVKPHSHCAQYCAAMYVQYCAVLHGTAQYDAVERRTAQRRALLRGVADILLMLMYAN